MRARDSATIALSRAAPDLRPEVLDALRPECNPEAVVAALEPAVVGIGAGHVLLVGHQPQLGLLAGLLTGGPAPPFAPGSMVRIQFPGPLAARVGVADWHLAPGFAG